VKAIKKPEFNKINVIRCPAAQLKNENNSALNKSTCAGREQCHILVFRYCVRKIYTGRVYFFELQYLIRLPACAAASAGRCWVNIDNAVSRFNFFIRRIAVEITEVRITLRSEEKLKAFASITFDDCFVVRGLKVISGSQGYFVSMPSRKRKDGSYQDIAHPVNNDMRKKIEDKVLDAFESEMGKGGAAKAATGIEEEEADLSEELPESDSK
jgi:stage V sporulation protein G